jgi:hypothetical protein
MGGDSHHANSNLCPNVLFSLTLNLTLSLSMVTENAVFTFPFAVEFVGPRTLPPGKGGEACFGHIYQL